MEAISLGIDLIATDLPAVLTSMGYAFSRYDMTPLDTKTDGSGEPPAKKAKKEEATSTADSFYINIRDRKYARDLKPLVSAFYCALLVILKFLKHSFSVLFIFNIIDGGM